MSETKHTPGPWKVGYQSLDVQSAGKGGYGFKVCDIRGWGYLTGGGHGALGLPHNEAKAIQEANARLIAAAPDLLDSVRGLYDYLNRPASQGEVRSIDVLLVAASRAIAKAEGAIVADNHAETGEGK